MFSLNRVVCVVSLSLAACGGQQQEAEAPVPPPPPAEVAAPTTPSVGAATSDPGSALGTSSGTGTTDTATTPAAAPAPEPLTDEQIALAVDLVNTGEIDQARVAQGKAKNARVKKFAQMMINHHTAAKQKQAKLLTKSNMKPAESPLSSQLTADASSTLSTLKSTATDFDRVYIDSQVDAHQKALDALDSRLIPNAKNEEFRQLLQEQRGTVEAHLKEARELQTTLAAGATTGSTGTGAGTSGTGPGTSGTGTGSTGSGNSGSGTGKSATGTGTSGSGTGSPGTTGSGSTGAGSKNPTSPGNAPGAKP